jgi:hypothetical protein
MPPGEPLKLDLASVDYLNRGHFARAGLTATRTNSPTISASLTCSLGERLRRVYDCRLA